jgi:hypothetical protein
MVGEIAVIVKEPKNTELIVRPLAFSDGEEAVRFKCNVIYNWIF